MPPQLRAAPDDSLRPPKPPAEQPIAVAGSHQAALVDSLERQLRILELTANGIAHELRSQPTLAPLTRYAGIQIAAVEQLQVDLLALIQTVRE